MKNLFSTKDYHLRGHLLFFTIPCGVHIIIDLVLFVLTAIHCSRVKAEIHRFQVMADNDVQYRKKKFVTEKAMFVVIDCNYLY